MPIQQKNLYWCKQLFASEDVGAAATILAAALGDISQGDAAGVFLLDTDKSQLLLFGSWSASAGERKETLQPVSIHSDSDPLCFCLVNGAPYQAELNPTPTMTLLRLGRSNVYAMPLTSRLSGTLGGILVGGPSTLTEQSTASIQVVAVYASSIMENMLLKRNHSSVITSLRNNVEKLEKQTEQERLLAANLIVGSSPVMTHVRNLIIKAAPTKAAVLITGETGTGKEATAEAIHSLSRRSGKPFLKINCGALSPQLLESELFGHVKGSFTGAKTDYVGLLRSASGGSILLDEAGDMPMELQVKLLRVLQDKRVRPVGGAKDYVVDIRIMAATNKDLGVAMDDGLFRKDLYHRIAALDIHIPPLRDRRQDIPELATYFFEKLCKTHSRHDLKISQEDLIQLSSLPLLGNARELANVIEKAILLSETTSGYISLSELLKKGLATHGHEEKGYNLSSMLEGYEADLIKRFLEHNLGNITKAAEALCIPRTTLRRKIQKLRLGQFIASEVQ